MPAASSSGLQADAYGNDRHIVQWRVEQCAEQRNGTVPRAVEL